MVDIAEMVSVISQKKKPKKQHKTKNLQYVKGKIEVIKQGHSLIQNQVCTSYLSLGFGV